MPLHAVLIGNWKVARGTCVMGLQSEFTCEKSAPHVFGQRLKLFETWLETLCGKQ